MYAATAAHYNIVKLLLEKGASVNFQKGIVFDIPCYSILMF